MTPQPVETISGPPALTGVRKAAMFVMGLGNQHSSELIRQLDEHEIRSLSEEIAALQTVPPEQMLVVFKEFETLSASSRFFAKGGPDKARKMIEQAIGKESTEKMFDAKPLPIPEPPKRPGGPFQDTDPEELARVLREESPQTLALILSNIDPVQAAQLLCSLPAETQPKVALRIALMDRISPDVFNRIAQAIRARLKATKQLTRSNGYRALASVLNHVESDVADRLLDAIEPTNQTAAATVRDLMFVFEDVINIDKEGIKALLAAADRKVLTMALKGTSEKIRNHFSSCMSQRSAEMLFEDMDALGPVRIREVTGAQQQIVTAIRQLQKAGTIVLSSGGGGEEYVV